MYLQNIFQLCAYACNQNTKNKRVLLICGMGWPQEVDQDPDNNRCRPCPFVEETAKDRNSETLNQ